MLQGPLCHDALDVGKGKPFGQGLHLVGEIIGLEVDLEETLVKQVERLLGEIDL